MILTSRSPAQKRRHGTLALVALAGALTAGGAVHADVKAAQSTAPLTPDNATHRDYLSAEHTARATTAPAEQRAPEPSWHLGALLALGAGALAYFWRRGGRQIIAPVAKSALRTAAPIAKVAGQVVAGAAGMGVDAARAGIRAMPRRLRWRFYSVLALVGGVFLLIAQGWGVWLALALLLAGAVGMVATMARRAPANA